MDPPPAGPPGGCLPPVLSVNRLPTVPGTAAPTAAEPSCLCSASPAVPSLTQGASGLEEREAPSSPQGLIQAPSSHTQTQQCSRLLVPQSSPCPEISRSAHTTQGQRTLPRGQCTPPGGQHTPLGVSAHTSGSAHTASGLLSRDLAELKPPAPPSAGACWSGHRDFLLQDSEPPPRAKWPAEQAVPSIHVAHGTVGPHVPQGPPSYLGIRDTTLPCARQGALGGAGLPLRAGQAWAPSSRATW